MRIGIDLGGTKIELIALDAAGREILRERVATPQGDYDATVGAIVSLVGNAEKQLKGKASVGIGIPGVPSRVTGLIKNSNSTCLIGRDLNGDVERALGREIRIANDANCFALSEAVDGAGTGAGGGVVVNGEVLVGPNAIAGEWGHNPLPSPRKEDLPLRDCYCGRKGCIEAYLSGPALAKDGENLDRYEERLARALAGVVN